MTVALTARPRLYQLGSKGPDVAKIQSALQNEGFSPGRVDSYYGSKTAEAVRNFQKAHHLVVDGIVGRDTLALLQKDSTTNTHTQTQVPNYTVQPGDSLYKIAQKLNVSVDSIKKVNPTINENNLQIGTKIVIPNGSVSKPTPTPAHVAQPGGTSKPSTSGDNYEKVWEFFKLKGCSDEATAGIMGNLKQESQMNPREIQKHGRGRGLAQWSTGERWERLVKFAHSKNQSEWDLSTQLDFIWKELTEDPWFMKLMKKYSGSMEQFKKITNINEAVDKFEKIYEQAGNPVLGVRQKYAHEIYSQFAQKSAVKRTMG